MFGRGAGANHEGVTDPELVQRARNAGIATEYTDWRGRPTEVPPETLTAILDALGTSPVPAELAPAEPESEPAEPESEPAEPESEPAEPEPAEPEPELRPVVPSQRQWGFTVQLYSLRSSESWGHGDLHDLAELARWSATELGAGFVLINPLHAAEPLPPVSPSPYLPMTRLFTSPLYLRVEDVPEYGALAAADKARSPGCAAPLRAANAHRRPDRQGRRLDGQARGARADQQGPADGVPAGGLRQVPGRTWPRP